MLQPLKTPIDLIDLAKETENILTRPGQEHFFDCCELCIFLSEHTKFIGLIHIGSCCWRHRVFSGGYVTGRPLQNSRTCWASLWRGGHTYFCLSTQNLSDSLMLGVVIGDIGFQQGLCYRKTFAELEDVLGESVEGWTYFHLSM